jgi:hypothetical protein
MLSCPSHENDRLSEIMDCCHKPLCNWEYADINEVVLRGQREWKANQT